MRISKVADILARVPILRELDLDTRLQLAQSLPQESYNPGDAIIKQGERPDSMAILLRGEVEILKLDEQGQQQKRGALGVSDLLGVREMVYRQPRTHTIKATTPVEILRWERKTLTAFMKEHASVLSSLQFLAQSQELASRLKFDWLRDDEVVHALTRKHSFILYQMLTVPALLVSAALVVIFFGGIGTGSTLSWVGAGLGLAGLLFGLWQWIDWRNDYYLVTNRRAVWLEKIVGIYDSRREAPLHTVLSVTVNTDVTGRMFGFGDVVIRTYTGKITFHNAAHPPLLAAMIEENWRRMRARLDATDRESLVAALEKRLESEEEQDFSTVEELQPQEQEQIQTGLDHWGFQIRFEEHGVITYRKHWAVLLREIFLPSALVMTIVVLLGARLGGWIRWVDLPVFLFLALISFAGAGLWWLYRYVDWANDIYQITAEQIVDVYKKPLAREERKVAPLENILGTEVDRKGLLGIVLNFGDVIANVGTSQFTFDGVFDPVTVQQDIVHAQEAFLERRAERERKKRQREMVELIDIYHGKYTNSSPEDKDEAS
ncbi:MAG: cyclic nucleotide-binding domain-containing protein [Anaerolineales bacterium]|jgi:hypothetical protein